MTVAKLIVFYEDLLQLVIPI